MSIYNIDSFSDTAKVVIADQTYTIRLATMHDYINDTIESALDRSKGMKAFLVSALRLLEERSSIPMDVLETLTYKQVETLLLIMQGIKPDEAHSGDSEKK
jgi:hypothetical protein